MKLVIYETTHHENLPALLELAGSWFKEVTVFLDEISYRNLNESHLPENNWPAIRFVRKQEQVNHRKFINSLFDFVRINQYTHLHLNTLSNNYLFFAFKMMRTPGIHVSLTVHELNTYRMFGFRTLRDITESAAKFYLHRRIRRYRGLIPGMQVRLKADFPLAKAVFIPSGFYVPRVIKKIPGPLKIVVPGTVESKRRDYNYLSHFISSYFGGVHLEHPVELVLLGHAGSIYGEEIVHRLQGSSTDSFLITTYKDYVSGEEYARQMDGAKLIWCPIRAVTTSSRGQEEIYGVTKSPGIYADLIRFPKPTLIPSNLNIPYYLQNCMIPYGSETELWQHMTRLLQSDNEEQMQRMEKDLPGIVARNFQTDFHTLMQHI